MPADMVQPLYFLESQEGAAARARNFGRFVVVLDRRLDVFPGRAGKIGRKVDLVKPVVFPAEAISNIGDEEQGEELSSGID